MNIKTKIIGLVSITLVAGIAIGAFGQRILIQQRIRGIFRMGAAGRIFPSPDNWLKPSDEAQKKAIREIFAKHGEQLADIHKRYRKEIDASFDGLDKDLDPILTPEQKKRLKDMRPKAPPFQGPGPGPFMGGPGGPGGPGFMIEELKKELSLTDDQAVRIQGIFKSFREKDRPEFREGPPGGDRKAFLERLKELDAEIEKVLSEKQQEAFRKFRKDRMRGPGGDEGDFLPFP
jgi:hypothetical protein